MAADMDYILTMAAMRAFFFFFVSSLLGRIPPLAVAATDDPLLCGSTEPPVEGEPIATADVIVVGSGPGGSGFLRRFTSLRPDSTVLWFEKGGDVLARNWPQDIEKSPGVLTPIPRTNLWWLQGYAWNVFGGGDACNSGGPNYLDLDRSGQAPYDEVDVFALRNNSIIPPTPASTRWLEAFQESGYEGVCPLKSRKSDSNRVGHISSIRSGNGRERLLLAYPYRYSVDNNIEYVHARILRVLHDDTGRATGVMGVRLDQDQQEYGGYVTWKANNAVVLAAGVFNTFDLLVESGIGPREFLTVRNVTDTWGPPNEKIGKGLGEELAVVVVSVEPEKQDQLGAEPRLAAGNTDDTSFEMWSTGVFAWLRFKSYFFNKLLGSIVPDFFPKLGLSLRRILGRASMWGIGIDVEPLMSLKAVKKAKNTTRKYRRNPLGIVIDDSAVELTSEVCAAMKKSLDPMKKGLDKQKEATNFPSLPRIFLKLASTLGLFKILKPNAITAQNIKRYSSNRTKYKKSMLASYYHFYGGNAQGVVNDCYCVENTIGLYIADASVLRRLAPGGPSSAVMEEGMRVADALVADLDGRPCKSR